MFTNTWNENAESNAEIPQKGDTEYTTPEPTCCRTSQFLPDFLPFLFGQNTESTERSPKPSLPLFTKGESTWARSAEDEASASNTPQASAEDEENASSEAVDPEKCYKFIRPEELHIGGFPGQIHLSLPLYLLT